MADLSVSHSASASQPIGNGVVPTGLFAIQTANGASYNTSTTPTNVEGALTGLNAVSGFTTAAGTIPAGHLNNIGKVIRIRAGGTITNTATPNLTMAILLGTTSVATTGAVATATITGTSRWNLDVLLSVEAQGATGTVKSSGTFTYYTTTPVGVTWGVANTVVGTPDTVDLTVAQALHLQATWGASSASNALVCTFIAAEYVS